MLKKLILAGSNDFDYEVYSGRVADSSLDVSNDFLESGVKVHFCDNLVREINPLKDLRALLELAGFLRSRHYDIIHTHTSKAGFIGRLAARMARMPSVIYAPHGNVFSGYFSSLKTNIFILLERLAARYCDYIVTLTEKGIQDFLDHGIGVADQYVSIYLGIDESFMEPPSIAPDSKKKELGISTGGPIIAAIGRLEPIKGHRDLLNALPMIKETFPEIKALIVGDGRLRSELEGLIKELDLSDTVRITGWRHDVKEILSIIDLLVHPSHNEGLGLALLEAMAQGKPVVATKVGGVPEVVIDGKTGFLCSAEDPMGLAHVVSSLLKDPEKSTSMGVAGLQAVKDKFLFSQTVIRFESLYRELHERPFANNI